MKEEAKEITSVCLERARVSYGAGGKVVCKTSSLTVIFISGARLESERVGRGKERGRE